MNLPESATWESGIYQLETDDPVLGGPEGIDNVQGKQLANRTAFLKAQQEAHVANKGNPHATTKAQVGLSNVDNTSDANKPVSTAQAAADAAVANAAATALAGHAGNSNNPHGTTKAQIGLGSVDNTSDANKPVSTAQAAADAAVANAAASALSGHTSNSNNPHGTTKAQIGLGSVDNTADANKPVSTAQAAADLVVANAAAAALAAHTNSTGNPHGTTKAQLGLGSVDNTADATKPVSGPQQAALDTKLGKNGDTANEIFNSGWFRSLGNVGWYNHTYGGGMYMADATWVRVYGAKGLLTDWHSFTAGGNIWTTTYGWLHDRFAAAGHNHDGVYATVPALNTKLGKNGDTANEIYNSGWYRSVGAVGWVNSTYGGGIYQADGSWVRVYGSKGFLTDWHQLHGGGNIWTATYGWLHERFASRATAPEMGAARITGVCGDTPISTGYEVYDVGDGRHQVRPYLINCTNCACACACQCSACNETCTD